VLVEKPFAANAFEARRVADAAAESDLVVMEAHHTRHHPLVDRLRFLLAGGVLGTVESAAATFRVPIPPGRALPWNVHLGGGALMDVGCYPVRMLLDLFGSEPVVESARAWTRREVDRTIRADLRFGASVRASVDCSIWSSRIFAARVTVWGTKGRMRVSMPYHPHERARIRIDGPRGLRLRETASRRSSYSFQLEAFRDSIREGAAVVTDPAAAVRTMCVIDAIYRAAGMEPRTPGHVD
jgi:predicted dehydrogenase